MAKGSVVTDKQVELLRVERTLLSERCCLTEPPPEDNPDGPTKITFCSRADGNFCGVYAFPEKKWINFDCPMADDFLRTKSEAEIAKEKVRVGQQKQKKKSR